MSRAALFVSTLLLALTCSTVSQAQTVASTVSKWGMLGSWKVDCSRAANRDDPVYTYVLKGRRAFLDRDYGDLHDSLLIATARVNADDTLQLTINFTGHVREHIYAKSGGRWRVIRNRNLNTNEHSVRDGKYSDGGQTTVWLNRCR